ncbi:twin-arginine translocation signal domain-containing protein [Mesorhizobium onobrychidis]|nr:twin-arginine translocation signal domain-containing protein [Mesorhizobium onobrychidis]
MKRRDILKGAAAGAAVLWSQHPSPTSQAA